MKRSLFPSRPRHDASAWGLLDCTHYYRSAQGTRALLDETSFLPAPMSRHGLLVAPGAGKTTLARLLCGIEPPRHGHLLGRRGDATLLNHSAHLHPAMTGEENVRNIAHLVGIDPDETFLACAQLTVLGELLRQRVRHYSATAKALLAFALNLQLPSRFLLAENRLLFGDADMRQRNQHALEQALQTRGLIVITSNPRITRHVCDHHHVLVDGRLVACADHVEAEALLKTTLAAPALWTPEASAPPETPIHEQF